MTPEGIHSPAAIKKINWRFHSFVFVGFVIGCVIVLLVELGLVPVALKDFALGLGGAFIGLVSLSFDDIFRDTPERLRQQNERFQDQQKHDAEHTNDQRKIDELQRTIEDLTAKADIDEKSRLLPQDYAYYLGHTATQLPEAPDTLPLLRTLCYNIRFPLSDEEERLLDSEPPGPNDLQKISELVIARAEKRLDASLEVFFELGNKVEWLVNQIKHARSTQAALNQFEAYSVNPYIQMNQRYSGAIDEVLQALRPCRDVIPDDARESLQRAVGQALSTIPAVYVHSRNTVVLVPRSPWRFANDAVLWSMVSHVPGFPDRDLMIGVRDSETYEVVGSEPTTVQVTHDEIGWHCSAHAQSSEKEPCFEIRLVLGVTDGGNPPRNAAGELLGEALRPVRFVEVKPDSPPDDPTSDHAPG